MIEDSVIHTMNISKITLAILLSVCSAVCLSAEKVFLLSGHSEEYNLHYLYHQNFPKSFIKDTIIYINKELPESFVIELGGLKNGQKSILVYNDNHELLITKRSDRYIIGGKWMRVSTKDNHKLSLYFVNGKVIAYADEKNLGYISLRFNHYKRIGVKCSKNGSLSNKYLCCYEPCEFKEMNYGQRLDSGILPRVTGILTSQGVGEPYSLTFPKDTICNSPRSIRFEYRFEDSKKEGKTKTQRGRSEIAGVSSSSLMGKWIIEFDFLVPHETDDDSLRYDMITQLHDHSTEALSPAFCLLMKSGELSCRLRGDSIPVEQWKKRNKPASGTHILPLGYLKKDTWHHVKVYLKLAYQRSMNPQTIIWLDSKKVLESNLPNCYNYTPKKAGMYDYIKFGIYKSSWLGLKQKPEGSDRRIYYFDNFKVKY